MGEEVGKGGKEAELGRGVKQMGEEEGEGGKELRGETDGRGRRGRKGVKG